MGATLSHGTGAHQQPGLIAAMQAQAEHRTQDPHAQEPPTPRQETRSMQGQSPRGEQAGGSDTTPSQHPNCALLPTPIEQYFFFYMFMLYRKKRIKLPFTALQSDYSEFQNSTVNVQQEAHLHFLFLFDRRRRRRLQYFFYLVFISLY